MKTGFALSLGFILFIYIVVEVTMNMVKNGSWRSQQFENVNFEPRIPGIV